MMDLHGLLTRRASQGLRADCVLIAQCPMTDSKMHHSEGVLMQRIDFHTCIYLFI